MKDIEKLKERLLKEFDYLFWAEFDYEGCLILARKFEKKLDKIFKEFNSPKEQLSKKGGTLMNRTNSSAPADTSKKSEKEIEEIAKMIDPDNTFLKECEEVVNKRFDTSNKKGCGKVFDFIDKKYGVLRLQCGVWTDLRHLNGGANFMKMELCPECKNSEDGE